ncbi:hypothetical protein [Empedobacter brevis]|uniref:hypothetical protein n=1 Tax=Empedobacter brevis TaxID=247 RepID=UPI0023F4FC19|nr:hypothetical protein [Empedobacter brevis]
MAKNKISDLNDHLFLALERLNDNDMDVEKLELEEKRVKAISSISHQIISASNLVYKVAVSVGKGDIDPLFVPENLNTKQLKNENNNS